MLKLNAESDAIVNHIRADAGVWGPEQLLDLLIAGRRQRPADYETVIRGIAKRLRNTSSMPNEIRTTTQLVRDSVSARPMANSTAHPQATQPARRRRSCSQAHARTPRHSRLASWLG